MAYGKIKADALIYDNSGSDVEKAVSSLGTPEGTAIKSTGESGGTKFLREDGDNTCSWQNVPIPVPTFITVADESSDTTCFPLFATAATGNAAPKTGSNLTFNSNTGILTATGFAGDITGNVTGNASGSSGSCTGNAATATEATNITAVANNSTDETVYPTFVDGATGTQGIETDTGLTYNPSTGLLTAVGLTLSGNLTVNGSTTTVNTATLNVEDKNIELGKVSSPSDTTADGGGITLKGATDKTITWTNATDTWDFNQNIKITTGSLNVVGIEGGPSTINLDADEGDDNADIWRIQAGTSGSFTISTYSTGSYVDAISLNSLGDATFVGNVSDSKGDVRDVPVVGKSSAYTLVASDAGKAIYISTGGVTVPASVLSGGKAVTILNDSGSDQTITQGSGFTLYNSADASTGNRTLAGRGMATILFTGTTAGYISGAGLS